MLNTKYFKPVLWAIILCAGSFSFADIDAATCFECHEDIEAAITLTVHTDRNGVSCESCHGNADVHIDDPSTENIITFAHDGYKKTVKTCITCHTERIKSQSSHFKAKEGCLNCHQLGHSGKYLSGDAKPEAALLKKENNELCLKCHSEIRMKMHLPYTHPSDEYDNTCINCHNSHETKIEYTQKRVEKKCKECHPEASGPFVYTHLATEKYGCKECHNTHGSTNPNLLNKNSVRFLCLSCHSDTPEFHDMSNMKYQQCTACHSAIHGSNMNRLFFR